MPVSSGMTPLHRALCTISRAPLIAGCAVCLGLVTPGAVMQIAPDLNPGSYRPRPPSRSLVRRGRLRCTVGLGFLSAFLDPFGASSRTPMPCASRRSKR